jgi:hypothetical protein
MPVMLALKRLRQEDHKFEARLNNIAKAYHKTNKQTKKTHQNKNQQVGPLQLTFFFFGQRVGVDGGSTGG